MRSPKDMGIIEIDITNACVHSCSNCTRFCGHHKKPYFMEFEDFKRAVDSLADFKGQVGVMGGEPTIHPHFKKFADYIRESRVQRSLGLSYGPILDMQFHIDMKLDGGTGKVVLLSSLCEGYYKNFEVINETFAHQLLNDHSSDSMHQALLMSRHELGVSDDEWIKKRDACWIQNEWSASITPKGAFFCEVAGALDMLFGGPGGWDVEPGWWKREPKDFGEQLNWCEFCSACLDAPKRLSRDERDDVTPGLYERLVKVESPKALQGKCIVRDPKDFDKYSDKSFETGTEYIEAGNLIRISDTNKVLLPHNIDFWINGEKEYKDWILCCKDTEEDAILTFLKDKVWNPGYMYILDGDIIFFNVKASVLQGFDIKKADSLESVVSLYPDNKKVYVETKDPLLFLIGGEVGRRIIDRYKNLHLLIYGAGHAGRIAARYLIKNGYDDFDVVVSEGRSDQEDVETHKVHEITEFVNKKDDVLILIAVMPTLYDEVLQSINKYGFKNYCFAV